MEEKEITVSWSPTGYSETESPPVSGDGGGMVPHVMNMAANIGMERSLGATAGSVGGISSGGGSGDLLGKKKRGRPRKYDSDGNLRISYKSPPPPPPPGFSFSPPSSEFSSKRGRGRPPGSGNWQLLASLGELFATTAGGDFTPHVVTVNTGEGPRGVCVLSANGAVSNVTIRQPGSSGGLLTYEAKKQKPFSAIFSFRHLCSSLAHLQTLTLTLTFQNWMRELKQGGMPMEGISV
ncbi:hypothetical protein U1Q18_014083, partial [Sarracenia purpurea var. burkii]